MVSLQQKHILLVEDDADTLSATTAMLERLGYSVTAETEGLKALRTFSEEPDRFDLALLDHGMADVSGLELAQRFRRIRPGFPKVWAMMKDHSYVIERCQKRQQEALTQALDSCERRNTNAESCVRQG